MKLTWTRSVKETKRLHQLAKSREPLPKVQRQKPKLPSLGSASTGSFDSDPDFDSDLEAADGLEDDVDEDELGDSDVDDDEDMVDDDDLSAPAEEAVSESGSEDHRDRRKRKKQANEEADYERSGRMRWVAEPAKQKEENDTVEVGRLPIKLPTGEVQNVKGSTKIQLPPSKKPRLPTPETEESEEEEVKEESAEEMTERMAGLKGKFGRMGVAEIVGRPGMRLGERVAAAKEQIASTGAEILAGGELVDIVSASLLSVHRPTSR